MEKKTNKDLEQFLKSVDDILAYLAKNFKK